MELAGFRQCLGPSLYADHPAIVATLRIPANEQALLHQHAAGVAAAARQLVDALGTHPLPADTPDTELSGTGLIAHLSARLLWRLESDCRPPSITRDPTGEILHLAYSDPNIPLVRQVLITAIRAVLSLYPDSLAESLLPGWATRNPEQLCRQALDRGRSLIKGRTFREVRRTLEDRQLPWLPLDRYASAFNQLQIGYGCHQQVFNGTTTFGSSMAGINISYSKLDSRMFLEDLGFPVTRQRLVNSSQQAVAAAQDLGYPVVLKSNMGAHGDGVYPDLRDAGQVREAFDLLAGGRDGGNTPSDALFVENFVRGNDYRLTLVKGRLLNALHRKPPQVTGDGEHSIAELVERENRHPRRGDKRSSQTAFVPLKLEAAERATLAKQGLDPAHVPDKGQRVTLRSTANWSNGGTLRDVGHLVHPDNLTLARRIAESLQIDMLGVDVITDDIGRSWREGGLTVIEVNHSPGIFGVWDEDGRYIDQGVRIVDSLAPDVASGQFPIVVVEQDPAYPELASSLGEALRTAGYRPGVSDHRGMTINGEPWARPEAVNHRDPALALLRNRTIDTAVVQRRTDEMLDGGVGVGGCDICVLTAASDRTVATTAWPGGINAAAASRLLLRSVRRRAIVLVDDPGLAALAGEFPPDQLCVVTAQTDNGPYRRLVDGGALGLALTVDIDGSTALEMAGNNDGERQLPLPGPLAEPVPFLVAAASLLCLGLSLDGIAGTGSTESLTSATGEG